MRLHCEFSTPVARTDLDDYIRHLEIGVGCYDEDALNEYVVGKLAVDQIMWMNALVDGVSLHSETQEELVVYRQEYGDHGLWVRPQQMFLETVTVDGKTVPRFQYLGGQA